MRRRLNKDQRELVARARAGDRGAAQELLAETEGLVRKMAGNCIKQFSGMEYEDLVQIGLIGVVEAIDTFDLERPVRFSTHAFWRIRGALSQARRLDNLIRLPSNWVQTAAGRQSHPNAPHVVASLDEPVVTACAKTYDDGERLGELIPAPDDTASESLTNLRDEYADLRAALDALPHRHLQAITLHYGLEDGRPLTLEETGILLGVSKECVRQRCEAGIQRLRENLKER